MRKPRSDSKLLILPEEQQLQIFNWLKEIGYTETKLMILEKYDISTSAGALNNFWGHWSERIAEERMLKAVTNAKDVMKSVGDNLPLLNKATQAALQQVTFEAIMSGADHKLIKNFSTILLKSRALDQADQTLSLRLREFEQKITDAQESLKKAKADGGMTVEAIEQMEQQLNLL